MAHAPPSSLPPRKECNIGHTRRCIVGYVPRYMWGVAQALITLQSRSHKDESGSAERRLAIRGP